MVWGTRGSREGMTPGRQRVEASGRCEARAVEGPGWGQARCLVGGPTVGRKGASRARARSRKRVLQAHPRAAHLAAGDRDLPAGNLGLHVTQEEPWRREPRPPEIGRGGGLVFVPALVATL